MAATRDVATFVENRAPPGFPTPLRQSLVKLLVNEQLAADEAALLAELHSLEQDGEAIKRKNEESLEMIVSSPEKVSEEREVAAEELKLILE